MSLFGDIHQRIYRGPDDYEGAVEAAAGIVDQVGKVLKSPEGEGVYTDLGTLLTNKNNPNKIRNERLGEYVWKNRKEEEGGETPMAATDTIFSFLSHSSINKQIRENVDGILGVRLRGAKVFDFGDSEGLSGKGLCADHESTFHIQTEKDPKGYEEFDDDLHKNISDSKGFDEIDHQLVKVDPLEFVTLLKTGGADCIFISNINSALVNEGNYLEAFCTELIRVLPRGKFIIGHEENPVIQHLKDVKNNGEKVFNSAGRLVPEELEIPASLPQIQEVSLLLKN